MVPLVLLNVVIVPDVPVRLVMVPRDVNEELRTPLPKVSLESTEVPPIL